MLYKEQMGLAKVDQEYSEQNRSPSEKVQAPSKFADGTCGKKRERERVSCKVLVKDSLDMDPTKKCVFKIIITQDDSLQSGDFFECG